MNSVAPRALLPQVSDLQRSVECVCDRCWQLTSCADRLRSVRLPMAFTRGKSLLFCFGLACVLSASGQTVIPASNSDQAAVTPTPSFEAPGVSNPTICAQGDDSCSAALVQPDNDTDYTNCINSPSAPDCTSASPSAAIESAVATPEEACPTDSILDQGMSEADLETQVRSGHQGCPLCALS